MLPARYNDGGYSGTTLDRPATQTLLKDIEANKVPAHEVEKKIALRLQSFLLSDVMPNTCSATASGTRRGRRLSPPTVEQPVIAKLLVAAPASAACAGR